MNRTTLAVSALLLAVIAPERLPAASANVKVIGTKLEADPKVYEGSCPTTIRFHGSIETDGPGLVTYTFQRSDPSVDTMVKSLTFTAAPFQLNIPDGAWALGAPGMTCAGWMAIKIDSPNAWFLVEQSGVPHQVHGRTSQREET